MKTRLPQEPHDQEVDEFLGRLERTLVARAANDCDRFQIRLELDTLRRHFEKARRRLRDLDAQILDLRDGMVSAGMADG